MSRKEKRWSVQVKAHNIIASSSSVSTKQIVTGTLNASVTTGSTIFTTNDGGDLLPGMLLTMEYGSSLQEIFSIVSIENIGTLNTPEYEITIDTPFNNNHESGDEFTTVVASTELAKHSSIGDDVVKVNSSFGIRVNDLLKIGNDVVKVTQVQDKYVRLENPLYRSYETGTSITELDNTDMNNYTQPEISVEFFNVVKGQTGTDYDGDAVYSNLNESYETPWIEIQETPSFEEAKNTVKKLADILGIDNVRLNRVVDVYTVLYPIS